ncbi:MAG TPA: hypothetical protein VJ844_04670 [Mucilaginibacter sp.]|nr:hypothetical protein [Mucilaginibacter sp.]
MNNSFTIKSVLIIAFVCALSPVFAAKNIRPARIIEIAGLVVNAQDLSSVRFADIRNGDGLLLARQIKMAITIFA